MTNRAHKFLGLTVWANTTEKGWRKATIVGLLRPLYQLNIRGGRQVTFCTILPLSSLRKYHSYDLHRHAAWHNPDRRF